jgi:hypothetical protein
MWKSRRLTTLWASMVCYKDSFTFFLPLLLRSAQHGLRNTWCWMRHVLNKGLIVFTVNFLRVLFFPVDAISNLMRKYASRWQQLQATSWLPVTCTSWRRQFPSRDCVINRRCTLCVWMEVLTPMTMKSTNVLRCYNFLTCRKLPNVFYPWDEGCIYSFETLVRFIHSTIKGEVMPRAANLTEGKTWVRMFEFPTGVWLPEGC